METLTSLLDAKGCPLDQQKFTWREMANKPISKLDDDAFTRVRIILMNGIEVDALRLKHIGARFNRELRLPLAQVRRVEQHQATMVNWLISADHSPLETTVAYEQVAIEVTAAVAQNEPGRQGREQHPAKLHRHHSQPPHHRAPPRTARRPA